MFLWIILHGHVIQIPLKTFLGWRVREVYTNRRQVRDVLIDATNRWSNAPTNLLETKQLYEAIIGYFSLFNVVCWLNEQPVWVLKQPTIIWGSTSKLVLIQQHKVLVSFFCPFQHFDQECILACRYCILAVFCSSNTEIMIIITIKILCSALKIKLKNKVINVNNEVFGVTSLSLSFVTVCLAGTPEQTK